MNKVTLIGYLGKDVETGFMTNGDAWSKTSLATSEQWKDKSGEKQERTEWHNLVFFKRVAEIASTYLKKGSHICVEGKIQTRSWADKNTGEKKFMTEIVVNELHMLGKKEHEEAPRQEAPQKQAAPVRSADPFGDIENDIPF